MTRFSALLMLAPIFAAAADQPNLPAELTLKQALDIALQNSTNIRTAMAQLEQASGRYGQSRSALLPQVDVRARQDYLTVNLVGLGILVPGAQKSSVPSRQDEAAWKLAQSVGTSTSIARKLVC